MVWRILTNLREIKIVCRFYFSLIFTCIFHLPEQLIEILYDELCPLAYFLKRFLNFSKFLYMVWLIVKVIIYNISFILFISYFI